MKSLFQYIGILLLLGFLASFFSSCQKEYPDYRNAFVGDYYCNYVRVDQSHIQYPDSIVYYYDYTYDSNVLLVVTRAGDPDKLLIMGQTMTVKQDGTLEDFWVPDKSISGAFYPGDSIHLTQGIGKIDGYTETWNGIKSCGCD